MVTSLEIYHADPLGATQLRMVALSVIQLIVILICLLLEGHNVLTDQVTLARLHTYYQQQQSNAPGLLSQQDRTHNPFAYQFSKVDVQPELLRQSEVNGECLDANLVPELQAVVMSQVLHPNDVGLLGCKAGLTE